MEWGADEALEPEPADRLRPAERPQALPSVRVPAARPVVDQSAATPGERALALANGAETLAALHEALAGFDGCALRDTASNLVFAQGDPASTTLIIGEPPGREEDRSGQPFAGSDGALLDQMLASAGLDRAKLMLTPLLPWRPPGGRPPNAGEMALCMPFLHRLIVLLAPRRLVLFGGATARALLPAASVRRRPAPEWVDCRIPGLHQTLVALSLPGLAEMQKTPGLRRTAWAGMRLLRRVTDAEVT